MGYVHSHAVVHLSMVALVSLPDLPQNVESRSGVLKDISCILGRAILRKVCYHCIFKSGTGVSDASVHNIMNYYRAPITKPCCKTRSHYF